MGMVVTLAFSRETMLDWLSMGCTEMRLIEKADSMLHVTWTPPDIFEPEYRHLHTHYRVTIEPVDGYSMRPGARKNYTVMGEQVVVSIPTMLFPR